LAPIPPTEWSQDTIIEFVNKYNVLLETETQPLDANKFTEIQIGKKYMAEATEDEAKKYIQNGKWPYCSYISDYLDNNPTAVSSNYREFEIKINVQNMASIMSNRMVYSAFILNRESSIKPIPESYKIFKGSKIPYATKSSSNLSASNYTNLQDICKNI
jgi:outer membrane receptor for Fe3+-dicitrate